MSEEYLNVTLQQQLIDQVSHIIILFYKSFIEHLSQYWLVRGALSEEALGGKETS